jgi:hypothetical protein
MKIILTEQSTLANNGKSLNSNLPNQYSIFSITKNNTLIQKCELLIKHGTLTGYNKTSSQWLIETGGTKQDIPPTDKQNVGQISWDTFIENIENFLKHVENKTELTKEDIEVLYAVDPKLEVLLTPFQSVLPLDSEWKKHKAETKEDLWQKRTDLIAHINK